jgi:hypothetical protein
MTQPTDHTYPDHWTDSAVDTYEAVLDERPDLVGADHSALVQAVELIAAADVLDAASRTTGAMTRGSTGQTTVNPAIVEARLARTAAAQILARLTVPSTGAKTASQRGRDAARARYAK